MATTTNRGCEFRRHVAVVPRDSSASVQVSFVVSPGSSPATELESKSGSERTSAGRTERPCCVLTDSSRRSAIGNVEVEREVASEKQEEYSEVSFDEDPDDYLGSERIMVPSGEYFPSGINNNPQQKIRAHICDYVLCAE